MTGTYYLLYPLPSLALGRAAVVSTAVRRPDTELAKLIHLTGRLLDVAHLILLTHAIYGYAVTNFGQFEALARPPEYVLVVEVFLDTSDRCVLIASRLRKSALSGYVFLHTHFGDRPST